MPIEVELPDGTIAEFPDGTSNATMEMALARYRARPAGRASAQPAPFRYPEGATLEQINAQNRAYSASPQAQIDRKNFELGQLAADKRRFQGLPAAARATLGAGASVERAVMGAGQLTGLTDDQDEIARRQRMAQMEGDTAATVGQIGGDIALTAIPLSRVGNLGRLGQYSASAGVGAGMGALQPVLGDESRGFNAALGGALGAAGQGLAHGLSALGSRAAKAVTPELRRLYQAAKARGIQLTPAQLSDSQFVKRATMMLDRMPFSGASGRSQAQTDAVNREVAKAIGQNADRVDQSFMSQAYDAMSQEYDNIFSGGMRFDRSFLKDLATVKREAAEQLDDTANKVVGSILSRVRKQGAGGQLQGRALQSIDRIARRAQESGDADRVLVGEQVRDAIRQNIERTAGPATRNAIQDLNRRYTTYKTVEPLVARSPEAGISPAQLLGAVNATKRGRARMARGEAGELGELAKIGQRMRLPTTSGTAENIQAGALGGGLLASPLRTLGLLGASPVLARAANSGLLADYLMSAGRGQGRQLVAPYLRPASTPFIGLFADEDPDYPGNRP